MSEFIFSVDAEAAAEVSTGTASFGVIDTGVYEGTIKFASLDKTKNGNNTVTIKFVTEDGFEATIWSLCIDPTWKSGAKNFDYAKFQQLAIACGMKNGAVEPYDILNKDGGVVKTVNVFTELTGKECTLAIQKELGYYKGEEQEKNKLHSTYVNGDNKIEKVADRIKDLETKEYKAYKAGGGITVEEDDSGSLLD